MTDYVITAGRSSTYPSKHYGAHFIGNRATFCLDADFAALDANVLAIPNLPISVLSASPVSVGPEFFGMHINKRVNDTASEISYGTIRSHDMGGTRGAWFRIQDTSSADTTTWKWADLDSWVNTHYAAGRDLVCTLFGTPTFFSARPTEEGVYGAYALGIQAEPADMTKWSAFCTAVATRYLGKIKYYEVWNEPNYHNNGTTTTGPNFFFSGTFGKLSEMVRRANQAIKAVDPTAKIICPAVQGWQTTFGASDTYFTGMMAASDGAGGIMRDWVDIIGVHLYSGIQSLAGIIDRINADKATAGVLAMETWDTESGPTGPDVSGLSDDQAKTIIARSMLTIAAKGVKRTMFYMYDSSTMGIVNRPAVIAYREAIRTLLMGGTILAASKFGDGRVAYYTSAGLTII